jgi:hypothetical protein
MFRPDFMHIKQKKHTRYSNFCLLCAYWITSCQHSCEWQIALDAENHFQNVNILRSFGTKTFIKSWQTSFCVSILISHNSPKGLSHISQTECIILHQDKAHYSSTKQSTKTEYQVRAPKQNTLFYIKTNHIILHLVRAH